jgi:signal peptidase I
MMKKTISLTPKLRRFVREELKPLVIFALVMFAFRSAIADWNDVPTGSMKPTILEGDRVLVNKLAYDLKVPFTTWHLAQWDNPKRGDIVVFHSPADGMRLVKRVVGLPGDRVELVNNELFVNGAALKYEALPRQTVAELPSAEQPFHEFATEELGSHPHPVMATPTLPARRTFGPVIVPAGRYFMMGDNRDNSFDSRYYGSVDRREILGRASAVVMSMDHGNHYLPRWHRFFTALP